MGLNDHGPRGLTPLHEAVIRGDALEVRRMLASGADPNIRDLADTGMTPFAMAVAAADGAVVDEFVADFRTDWNKPGADGRTAAQIWRPEGRDPRAMVSARQTGG